MGLMGRPDSEFRQQEIIHRLAVRNKRILLLTYPQRKNQYLIRTWVF